MDDHNLTFPCKDACVDLLICCENGNRLREEGCTDPTRYAVRLPHGTLDLLTRWGNIH
jgi:hypothetical protein